VAQRLNAPELREQVGPLVLYVLAELGKPDPGGVTRLYEDRAKLPLYGKALLASAMVASKSDASAIATIAGELEASLRLDGQLARAASTDGPRYDATLDSDLRTSALVLRALLHANPRHPLAEPLARGLLADRVGGRWRSTQEAAWALLALADYRRAAEAVSPQFVARAFLGDDLFATDAFEGRSLATQSHAIGADRLVASRGAALAFQVEGQGKLYYQARVRYALRELPTEGIDRGFFVDKRLRTVTASGLADALATVPEATTARFVAGDLVLADLLLVNPKPRSHVVLDDPLPAGFEAIDLRLATTSGRLEAIDQPSDDDGYDATSGYTREVRDDRVLFFVDHLPAGVYRYRYLARATTLGSFVVPPTRAEGMYAPEIFGRTGATRIEVAPKRP
jgi:uncharacterized protein YfaS (alpha-2-macroglobulin family)